MEDFPECFFRKILKFVQDVDLVAMFQVFPCILECTPFPSMIIEKKLLTNHITADLSSYRFCKQLLSFVNIARTSK